MLNLERVDGNAEEGMLVTDATGNIEFCTWWAGRREVVANRKQKHTSGCEALLTRPITGLSAHTAHTCWDYLRCCLGFGPG